MPLLCPSCCRRWTTARSCYGQMEPYQSIYLWTNHRCCPLHYLLHEIDSLEVSSDCWLPDNMIQAVMPAIPRASELGVRYTYVPLFGRCRLESFVPGSAADLHLARFHALGKFLLAITGTVLNVLSPVLQLNFTLLDSTHLASSYLPLMEPPLALSKM
jgi:hypothetical protein